jgi:hypothetical protein
MDKLRLGCRDRVQGKRRIEIEVGVRSGRHTNILALVLLS